MTNGAHPAKKESSSSSKKGTRIPKPRKGKAGTKSRSRMENFVQGRG